MIEPLRIRPPHTGEWQHLDGDLAVTIDPADPPGTLRVRRGDAEPELVNVYAVGGPGWREVHPDILVMFPAHDVDAVYVLARQD